MFTGLMCRVFGFVDHFVDCLFGGIGRIVNFVFHLVLDIAHFFLRCLHVAGMPTRWLEVSEPRPLHKSRSLWRNCGRCAVTHLLQASASNSSYSRPPKNLTH